MNKQKVKEIVKFSIRQNIQNKWFVIFNVLMCLLVIVMTNAGNIREFLESNNIKLFDDDVTIEYIDYNDILGNSFENQFKEYEKITVKKQTENKYNKDNIPDNLILVEVYSDEEDIVKSKVTSKEGVDGGVYEEILSILKEVRTQEFSKSTNVSVQQLEKLSTEVSVERVMLGVDAENSDTKQIIQYVSTIIVYMVSIFIFSKIANEIAQEKVSKSIEYVLTSVTAKEYLLAKIISVTSVVLIQAIYILVYYFLGNMINTIVAISGGATLATGVQDAFGAIDTDIIEYIAIVFVYAILTIILMSIIQAALSSKTTSMSEAGNTMTFLMVITIAVYMLTFSLINPYTNMTIGIYILSCIPLVSNYFIPAIIIIGQATTLQIVISLILLVVSIPITFNICSKIFKNGVLDYNSKKARKTRKKKELTLKEEQTLNLEKSKFRRLALVLGMSTIIVIVSQLIIQIIMQVLVAPLLEGIINESQISILVSLITSILSMTLPFLFVTIYTKKTNNEVNRLENISNLKMFLIAVFFTGIIQILLILAQVFLGLDSDAMEYILDIDGLDNLLTQILFVIQVAIIPGIFEELFFRKGLINLCKGFGEKFAIFVSALIFGIIHMNLTQGIFAFFMGIILGTLYVKTGKMRYNVILHTINNGYAALGTIFLSNKMDFANSVLDIIVFTILVIGGFYLIKELIRKIKNKEKLISLEGKIIPNNAKYILSDYTMILSIAFMICCFVATEAMLKIL